jgi:hypothetical protein
LIRFRGGDGASSAKGSYSSEPKNDESSPPEDNWLQEWVKSVTLRTNSETTPSCSYGTKPKIDDVDPPKVKSVTLRTKNESNTNGSYGTELTIDDVDTPKLKYVSLHTEKEHTANSSNGTEPKSDDDYVRDASWFAEGVKSATSRTKKESVMVKP